MSDVLLRAMPVAFPICAITTLFYSLFKRVKHFDASLRGCICLLL
jgi:hypothetical protein